MRRDHSSTLRLLRVAIAGAVALPVLLFAFSCWYSYRTVSSNVDDRLDRTLDVLGEQANRAFASIDLALTAALELVAGLSDDEIRARESELYARLSKVTSHLPRSESIWIFDRNGRPLLSTAIYPVPRDIDNSERDYFAAQREQGVGTFIGRVIKPRIGDAAIFALSRRRSGPEGQFLGVAAAGVQTTGFAEFYQRISRGQGSYSALLRRDGVFLARFPEPPQPDARLDGTSTIRQSLAQSPLHGRFDVLSQLDGISRRIGYRRIADYDVYVMAGTERSAIFAEWAEIIRNELLVGVPFTALLFIALGLAYVRTRRLYEETERRGAAEDALRHAQKMEAIGQLTGGVAHDFNNLLMVVEGNLSRLRKEVSGERGTKAMDAILAASERGKALTGRLLSFSRKQPITVQTIDVAEHARSMKEMLRRALPPIIDITVAAPNTPCLADVDTGELELAILNLAVNARDAMPGGGRLILRVTCQQHTADDLEGEFVRLDVEDTGVGISQENVEKVFEPFFTTKEAGKGTGLGLSQVYSFARQSGGTATVTSAPGQGTQVSLLLPLSSAHAPTTREGVELHPAQARSFTALVVDDNQPVGEATGALLEQVGCSVRVFNDPAEALSVLEKNSTFNVVFSDIVMPGQMDGLAFARALRARHPDLPVIFMTGYTDRLQEASSLGFAVLRKPFGMQELKGVLARTPDRIQPRPAARSS